MRYIKPYQIFESSFDDLFYYLSDDDFDDLCDTLDDLCVSLHDNGYIITIYSNNFDFSYLNIKFKNIQLRRIKLDGNFDNTIQINKKVNGKIVDDWTFGDCYDDIENIVSHLEGYVEGVYVYYRNARECVKVDNNFDVQAPLFCVLINLK